MNNIYLQIDNIKDYLLSLQESILYFEIINKIKKNKEMQQFFKAKKYYKSKMVIYEYKNKEKKYNKYKEKYFYYCEKIKNHPLYINYLYMKSDLLNLSDEIKEILKI